MNLSLSRALWGSSLIVTAAAMSLNSACATPAPSPHSTLIAGPAAVARDFYSWYIGLMAHDEEASDDPKHYQAYVSAGLRARIKHAMDVPDGVDEDYFTKTQDYLDEWVGNVAASPAINNSAAARTIVTLGSGAKRWRLEVTLSREGGVWKIAAVRRA